MRKDVKMSASHKNTDERQNAHGGAGWGWARTGGGVDERGTHLGGGVERMGTHGRRGGEVRPHGRRRGSGMVD